jgi:hydrogenase maturation factor
MKTGKISEPILKRSVLKKISYKDKSVLGRAAVGYDAAVVALDDYKLVTSTQTVVDKRDLHMNRAFIKAVNNLAAMGVEPKYAQISIVLPEGMREIKLKMLMDEMCEFARVRKISITGGNTMVSAGVVNPVVTVSVTGIAAKNEPCNYKYKEEVKPGYDIVMINAAALEATVLLAYEKEEDLKSRFTSTYIDGAKNFIEYFSVEKAAYIGTKCGVKAMHDMSDSGVFGALWELGEAGNCGMEINLKKINMRQETIEITNYLGINPYIISSTGSLLMVTSDGLGLIHELEKEGIEAFVIGKIVEGNDRVIINEDEKRYLEPPRNK